MVVDMKKINKCDVCGKEEIHYYNGKETVTNLPFGWCYLVEEVNKSRNTIPFYTTDKYTLCDECRSNVGKMLRVVLSSLSKKGK